MKPAASEGALRIQAILGSAFRVLEFEDNTQADPGLTPTSPVAHQIDAKKDWCERGDSNPHAQGRSILSRLRLPFRHSRSGALYTTSRPMDNALFVRPCTLMPKPRAIRCLRARGEGHPLPIALIPGQHRLIRSRRRVPHPESATRC